MIIIICERNVGSFCAKNCKRYELWLNYIILHSNRRILLPLTIFMRDFFCLIFLSFVLFRLLQKFLYLGGLGIGYC